MKTFIGLHDGRNQKSYEQTMKNRMTRRAFAMSSERTEAANAGVLTSGVLNEEVLESHGVELSTVAYCCIL